LEFPITSSKRRNQIDQAQPGHLILEQGSRVGVIGGGPAGAFFSYFLLDIAERDNLELQLDIYEPKDFTTAGPGGCNMCGGVLYESLIQSLAVEGINLPPGVVQRGIEYNMLHMDLGSVQIQTPHHEKRIATTFRGAGPRHLASFQGIGLDQYLLKEAVAKGARVIPSRVQQIIWVDHSTDKNPGDRLPAVQTRNGDLEKYDFLAVTSGVNSSLLNSIHQLGEGYIPPQTTRLLVREYHLGEEIISQYLGPVFHGFLLDIPGLDYGAIIPKGEVMTVCLLSSRGDLDPAVMDQFLSDSAVRLILPPMFDKDDFACHCRPSINVKGCEQPFADRMVFIGDSGVSRLYKDGIGAAYKSAKIVASTTVFQGISKQAFQKGFFPACRRTRKDNRIGKLIFRLIAQIQNFPFARKAVLEMVTAEQQGQADPSRGMSALMWDMLTGGAPYQEVLHRALHPAFWTKFLTHLIRSLFSIKKTDQIKETSGESKQPAKSGLSAGEDDNMRIGALGKVYKNGEVIVRQGEAGDCMYVVQEGLVEVIFESEDQDVELNVLGKDEFFGEMALFNEEVRTATVRARGRARILTVNHKNLLKHIHEDPSLAYRLMQVMSARIDRLSEAVADLSTPANKA
jgi:flavin-dependent dehydrogenase